MIIDDRKRIVGKVIAVAADKFVVELLGSSESFRVVGFDDVHYVAKLGSFIIIPVLADYVIAEVIGMSEREQSRQERRGAEDLDKTASARFLDVVPLGTLTPNEFKFGVSVYPTLYADALYATESELDRIFEVKSAEQQIPKEEFAEGQVVPEPHPTRIRALEVGRSAVFANYDVKVRVDEFFGGHIAVLGNTGSGKSCTVSAVVQSLFCKEPEYIARGATFVFLDVNGEYRRAFSKLPSPIARHLFRVSGNPDLQLPEPLDGQEEVEAFVLPHWFMSVEEWELLLMASERTQKPVLRTALGLATLFSPASSGDEASKLKNHILASCLRAILQSDASAPSKYDHIIGLLSSFHSDEITVSRFTNVVQMDYGRMDGIEGYSESLGKFIQENVTLPEYRHLEFAFSDLGKALDMAILHEESHGNKQIRDYCASMLTRFKWVRDREEFGFLRVPPEKVPPAVKTIELFLQRILGLKASNGAFRKSEQIIILDMNENDDDAVAVVASVVARLVFELLRKAEPRNRMPINLVLEEAHRYIAEKSVGHTLDASRIFERVAKEGRKYGLFLAVASQRPSELSRTVLSQCSNFIIHRIQNPEDLSHIRQMTPFMSEAVLRRLPTLPKQHALIFGNAVNMPMTVRVRTADPTPHSADAQISKLWFHAAEKTLEIPNSFTSKSVVVATRKKPKAVGSK